ncbi:MAG TPA: valine--tRNA ligase [Patescibacteria group bacterium]|nr:valine--tRNA ligase [Patescibacteria group bacterium]
MDKTYNHKDHEEKIYSLWENSGAFKESKAEKKYTILMPPPNANASLHAGHAMYTVDDILVRWRRMQGFSALWIPGRDHAGFETQFVYEKNLAKEGKSRMDYDRKTLYENIFKFVEDNSGLIFKQMKRLGFSADWDRSVFTLDKKVVDYVYQTFIKMESEGLVYRDDYIVNFCVYDGTSLAELEVKHVDRIDPLYFIKYKLVDSSGFITVATTRPEPIFVDTHLAVNPKDKKNSKLIGKKVLNPLTDKVMEIISDDFVDPDFGTGIVKLTPAHDANDYAVAKKHGLPIIACIDTFGRIKENGGKYAGMKVKAAREEVLKDLKAKDLIDHIDEKYNHSVLTCYKCGRDLEPMTTPNWFIKVDSLKSKVKDIVEKEQVKFHPKRFKTHMLNWLNIMHDWPISRQIVWGIRIPVWYKVDENPELEVTFINKNGEKKFGKVTDFDFEEVEKGLQSVRANANSKYVVSIDKPEGKYLPETDTFDTWFSSGQWPLVTNPPDYPTDVLGTLSDILKFWVSRMIMFSLYLKNEIPFKDVYMWSMVADAKGVKMSKSKGNVINPLDLVDKYGADALRMSLMYGTPAGSKVILSDDKVRSMRNFSNKVWNAGRYLTSDFKKDDSDTKDKAFANTNNPKSEIEINNKKAKEKMQKNIKEITESLERFRLDKASEQVYAEFWHWFCDQLIEQEKQNWLSKDILKEIYLEFLKLLHPFMPFVTESIYQELFSKGKKDLLITSNWPK